MQRRFLTGCRQDRGRGDRVVDIERVVNSAATIESLKKEGFWVYGTDPAGLPPWQIDLSGKVVLCFGGEAKGLRARTRKVCDELIGIAHARCGAVSQCLGRRGRGDLFEAVRQRSRKRIPCHRPEIPARLWSPDRGARARPRGGQASRTAGIAQG